MSEKKIFRRLEPENWIVKKDLQCLEIKKLKLKLSNNQLDRQRRKLKWLKTVSMQFSFKCRGKNTFLGLKIQLSAKLDKAFEALNLWKVSNIGRFNDIVHQSVVSSFPFKLWKKLSSQSEVHLQFANLETPSFFESFCN